MKLDNKPRAGKIRLLYILIPFILVIATGLWYLLKETKDFKWAIIAGATLLVFFIIMGILQLYYITFYAGPDKVRLRYKSLSPFPTQNNSIQINTPLFYDYKVSKKWGGVKKFITFYQNTPGGVAAFPKTCISALNADEIDKIAKALDLIKQLNKAKPN